MALKTMMLRRSIDRKKAELEQLRARDAEFETREQELTSAIEEAETPEQEQAVSEEIGKFEADKSAHEAAKTALSGEIEALEADLKAAEEAAPQRSVPAPQKPEERMMRSMSVNIRSLPKHVRAFDALPIEQRQSILAQEDVKGFLQRLREMGSQQRALSGGALTIPVVFLELISENMFRYSKLLDRVRVRPVRGQVRQTIAGVVPEAIWTEMCAAINELEFLFHQVTLDGYKVAGYVPVCNSLLEDSDINLASWIVEMLSESLGLAIDKAILYGKGPVSKMPLGIVTRLAQQSAPADYPANAPAWVDLHTSNIIKIDSSLSGAAFWSALMLAAGNTYTPYSRGELFWAMNSKTYATLRSKVITFTATGDVAANVFGYLPIITGAVDILEFIPDGDIIGGYGNLYLWAQRSGMEIELSREVQFLQDNTVFRGKERADGTPVIPGAFVAINIANQEVTTSIPFAADKANDVALNNLTIGTETLTPEFNPAVLSYTVTAANASDTVVATPAAAGAAVELSYNGQNLLNNGAVTWLADGVAHPLAITVKNGNGVRVYTVNVTKAAARLAESPEEASQASEEKPNAKK